MSERFLNSKIENDDICKTEYESTITIYIDESTFNECIGQNDVIFIFDDKTRLSQREYQYKIANEKTYILSFYNDFLFPIKRTKSIETRKKIDSLYVEKTVYRKIIYNEDNIRIALNKTEADYGVHFTCSGEIEYKENDLYSTICEYEKKLTQLMSKWYKFVKFDKLTNESLFSCCTPKIQSWICVDFEDSFNWAYKWNGVKAKMLYNDNYITLAPDANNIEIINFKCDFLKEFEYICFQVEITDIYIVIVELISITYKNIVYSMEPNSNVKFLKFLNKRLNNREYTINNKRLIVQQYYDNRENPLPKDFSDLLYDGLLINQNNMLFKVKLPTLDVKYIGSNRFLVGTNTILDNIDY